MNATVYDWFKLIIENKAITSVVLVLLSTTGFTLFDNFDKSDKIAEKDSEITAIQQQVSNVASLYSKPEKVLKTQSNLCQKLIKSHEKEYH